MNLSNHQIYYVLRKHDKTKSVFVDCVPCDDIPSSDRYPYAVVVNTQPTGQKGKHWIAIYVVSPTIAEYFDSSGRKAEGAIKDYLDAFPNVRDSDKPIQSEFTNVCGAYCTYFVIERCKGSTFSQIVNSLLSSTEADLGVCCYYYNLFK